MDIYEILNYKLLDTSSDLMLSYNWIYIPFNYVEALIWFGYIPRTILKYGKSHNRKMVLLQSLNFLLFGISDVIETSSTSVLLILFKLAILLALIGTHKAIISNRLDNTVT